MVDVEDKVNTLNVIAMKKAAPLLIVVNGDGVVIQQSTDEEGNRSIIQIVLCVRKLNKCIFYFYK